MTIGVETDSLVSLSNYGCLKSNGYTEAIIRAYQSVNRVDPNFSASAQNAQNAGLPVDALITATWQTPATAAADVAQCIKDYQLTVQTTWLFTEAPGNYWGPNTNDNRTVLTNLVKACKAAGLTVGIYTSVSYWEQNFGADFTDHSTLPLLYGHYDALRNFNDFTPFGGWTSATRKAYNGDTSQCNTDVVSFTWRP